jgi:hypothetical protein
MDTQTQPSSATNLAASNPDPKPVTAASESAIESVVPATAVPAPTLVESPSAGAPSTGPVVTTVGAEDVIPESAAVQTDVTAAPATTTPTNAAATAAPAVTATTAAPATDFAAEAQAAGVKFTGKPFDDQPTMPESEKPVAASAEVTPIVQPAAAPIVTSAAVATPVTAAAAAAPVNMASPGMPTGNEAAKPAAKPITNFDQAGPVGEEVVITHKNVKRGGGCFLIPRLGCRSIACLGCLLPLALIIAAILIFIFKPEGVWDAVTKQLNGNVSSQGYAQVSKASELAELKQRIQSSVEQGSKEIDLNEADFAAILKSKLSGNTENIYVDINPQRVSVLTNMDTNDTPLWLDTQLKLSEHKLQFTKLKVGQVNLPEFLATGLQNAVSGGLNVVNLGDTRDLVEKGLDMDLQISEVILGDGAIKLKLA